MAEKKKWAVLHYLVAEVKGQSPDIDKLQEEARGEIKKVVAAAQTHFDDMHVAYHVDFRDFPDPGNPRTMIQAKRAKVTSRGAFPIEEEVPPLLHFPEMHRRFHDLRRFFEWTMDASGPGHCPADHRVIVFWGHSAGPAGIFDLLDNGAAPPDEGVFNLNAISRRIIHFRERMMARVAPQLSLRSLAGAFKVFDQPCDLVLFKDCWMSTLELACQLAGHAGAVIASQSQIPIEADWPYERLFASLAELDGVQGVLPASRFQPVLADLAELYRSDESRGPLIDDEQPFFPSVPVSLLDVTKSLAIKAPLGQLVLALGRRGNGLSDEQRRSRAAFDTASTGALPSAAGDVALIDLKTLCEELDAFPSLRAAAAAVRAAVDDIVVESVAHGPTGGCRGVSVFYTPSPARLARVPGALRTPAGVFDTRVVLDNVLPTSYSNLQLNTGVPFGERWSRIAFEQPL
jgi:hypothetical protein